MPHSSLEILIGWTIFDGGIGRLRFCMTPAVDVSNRSTSNDKLNKPDQVADNRLPFRHGNRRLGKKAPKNEGEVGKLMNATARVQHMEKSKVCA